MVILEVSNTKNLNVLNLFQNQINQLGIKSGIIQNLKGPLTSYEKFILTDHILYIFQFEETSEPIGYLKFGYKNLFFYNKNGKVIEKNQVPCVLDFYIEENYQRQGIGLELFNYMLSSLSLQPFEFAYDRPSPKLISFLRNHFNLSEADYQPNRFVIYSSQGYIL